MSPSTAGTAALEFLRSRKRFGVRPGLERTVWLLAALGHPERDLRFVHVAGTNGKGSTCAYLASVLRAAGYRTGLYTSPDLRGFRDRMSVDGREIDEARLARLAAQVQAVLADLPADDELQPTEFEVTTAIAFQYFRELKADIVVLETGLGGRYDATNTVTPEVSVITNVGLDHMNILGGTVKKIAADKAGIIKSDRPVVTAADGEAVAVIAAEADRAKSNLYILGRDFRPVRLVSEGFEQRLAYFGLHTDWIGLSTPLSGEHQAKNAACALCALELLKDRGFPVSLPALRHGLANVRWAGRFERVAQSPLVVLDGAHNAPAAKALAASLPEVGFSAYVLVVGVLADKDVDAIARSLAPCADHIVATVPDHPRGLPPEQVAEVFLRHCRPDVGVEAMGSVAEAVRAGLAAGRERGLGVCVTGSLYTVAEAREWFAQERKVVSQCRSNE